MSLFRFLRIAAPMILSLPAARADAPAPDRGPALPPDDDDRPRIDWRPALTAGAQLTAWFSDVAHQAAVDPDDHDAIDRVHRYLAARLAGHRACCIPAEYKPTEVDLLTTGAALIDGFGLARGAGPALGALYAAIDHATRPAPVAVSTAPGRISLAQIGAIVASALTGAPLVAHGIDDNADDRIASRGPVR